MTTSSGVSFEEVLKGLDTATQAFALLAPVATHPQVAKVLEHAFSALAHMRQYAPCFKKALEQQKNRQWSEAFEAFSETITWLGFAEHNWGYTIRTLYPLICQAQDRQGKRTAKTSWWKRILIAVFVRKHRIKASVCCEDNLEESGGTITSREIQALFEHSFFAAMEERQRIFEVFRFCHGQQWFCFRQQTSQ